MSAQEFRDNDAGYLAWLATHPDGYVINIARRHHATEARVHHASCRTISGANPRGGLWTGPYVKVCAEQVAELERWAIDQVGEPLRRCGTCHPVRHAERSIPTSRTERAGAPPVLEGRSAVHGPAAGRAVVEAWADDYIRFERQHRPVWQEQLRAELRARCRRLEPPAGKVLHATFFGPKRPNADVENLVLYNIDAFNVAGRNGIRFEYGAVVPPAPDGAEYPFCYRYGLEPLSGTFDHWQPARTLASFNWTELGTNSGDIKAAQVWLALVRSQVYFAEQALALQAPFAVKIEVRPSHARQPRPDLLMKGIFDGVIAAFQVHTDHAVLSDVASRLATIVPADPEEISAHLIDRRRAVLGVVPRLVKPYRSAGVQWEPADHLCVAGELLPAEPVGPRWAIRGEIVELSGGHGGSATSA